jgi:hypothetical protein
MDIHHAMVVHNQPDRLYQALTQPRDLTVWMGAPTLARPEVGSVIEFHFDQGQRILKICYRTENPFAYGGVGSGSGGNRKRIGMRLRSRRAYCIARRPI